MAERRAREGVEGFIEGGCRYVLRDPRRLAMADSDLWNDAMYVQIDHRGRVRTASFNQPNATAYAEGLRCFYLRDEATGRFFSAPFDPVQAEPDEFEFRPGLHDCHWRNVTDGIEVALRLVVPRDDCLELWTATVTNVSAERRRVSLFSYLPIGDVGLLAHESWWDDRLCGTVHRAFPYYVRWEDYSGLAALRNDVFCACDMRPTSRCTAAEHFEGFGGPANPDALQRPRLKDRIAKHERAVAAYQFTRTLGSGKSFAVNLVFGPARDDREMRRLARKYLRPGGIEKAARRLETFATRHRPLVTIETPDRGLDAYVNHWLPRRLIMAARTFRFNNCPQGRNVIQDAMGAAYVCPDTSRELFPRIWAHQHADGFCPHGMPMAEGVAMMPIGAIPHRDTNAWGPVTVAFYLAETGDLDALDIEIPYADGGSDSLYGHLCAGLEWLLRDRSPRKLSHLGQGDWNDPLNMAGKDGKGESVWLTEALAVALDSWAPVAERVGDGARARRYRREAEACRRAVNRHAWDGQWYARGTTDAGGWFGTRRCREGRIFLNAQSWAILSGAAGDERLDACIAAVEKHLATPCGPMTLWPPFGGMREHIGKLTQKPAGMNENGSVYCHAATFYACALYRARRPEHAFRVLRTLLTGYGGNPIERSGQLPLYVPNMYRGQPAGPTAGRSSHNANTGAASWYYRAVVGMLLGVRAELDGLRVDPQLPRSWGSARVRRVWRGAVFDIAIRRDPGAARTTVRLDGEELGGGLIPPQRAGSCHAVEVRVSTGPRAGRRV